MNYVALISYIQLSSRLHFEGNDFVVDPNHTSIQSSFIIKKKHCNNIAQSQIYNKII